MTLRRPWACMLALGMLALCPGTGTAQTLYGVTWQSNGQLLSINTATGAGTLIGPLGSPISPFGLAFRGSTLYVFDEVADQLWRIDPATGATLGTVAIGIIAIGEGDLAFRADGIGFLCDAAGGLGQLWRFDVTVPNSTPITGLGGFNPSMDGLAFSASGVLYGLRQDGGALYTINQATGATTLVGNTGIIAGGFFLGGLAFDPAGNLFGSVSTIGGPSTLYRINPSTGAATLVGNIGINGVSGLSAPGTVTTPPPSGDEGSFPGSSGPGGAEGSFGFGGRLNLPVLFGPVRKNNSGDWLVFNSAHGRPLAMPTGQAPSVPYEVLSLALVAAVLAVSTLARRKNH